MNDRNHERAAARLLVHEIEQAIPDTVDLWPAVASRLAARRNTGTDHRPAFVGRGRRCTWTMTAVAALLLAVTGSLVWTVWPHPVGAQEIVQQARAAQAAPVLADVHTFALTQAMTRRTHRGEERTETRWWFQAPDRWRSETISTGSDHPVRSMIVNDGVDTWSYNPAQNSVRIHRSRPDQPFGPAPAAGENASLEGLLLQESTCYNPRLQGTESVAGRSAYVVDLGPSQCPSSSAPEVNGRRVIWVDKESFFLLKSVTYSQAGDGVVAAMETTAIQYNGAVDADLFTFIAPAGTAVYDFRPQPAPSADEFARALATLAAQADFPLFVPRDVPAGLVPRAPVALPSGIEMAYVPAGEAATDSAPVLNGITISQRRATPADVARVPKRGQQVILGPATGWYVPGVKNADGTAATSSVSLVRDGTWIVLSSFAAEKATLVRMAASLAAVPGGHPALPNPVPAGLAALREQVSYPIFIPTDLPSGLTPEPPAGGEGPHAVVRITYHDQQGAAALDVLNGPAGCCLDGDGRKNGEAVAIRNGISGHLLNIEPQFGGPILWWQEEGAYVALSGPHLTRTELLRIAASMSQTADLGATALPAGRPEAVVPAPRFTILRPTWLPEPMTVREQVLAGPPELGSSVILGFDPRPADPPHAVLTLHEMPGQQGPGAVGDPQAGWERIGGHEVNVVRRGEGCVTLQWTQGEVALTLTNAYDPPGQLRYTCEQMRRIVESVR